MTKIAIVTDSTASIPEWLMAELHIHCAAYYVHRGSEVLRDLVTIQRDEFLQWLATAKTLPTTACPGPGDYFEIYKRLADEDGVDEIVSIHISSKTSGAYQAASLAKSMLKASLPQIRVEVVDSLNASLCHGWMVIEAARAALAGKSLDSIVAQVRRMIPVTQMIQTADTLRYLYMGGRIGLAKWLAAEALNVKPLIGVRDGVVVPLGKARSRLQAYKIMADLVEKAVGVGGKIKVAYVHAGAQLEVEKIKQMIEERLDVVESFFAELSPALAVHTGPGTAGLCYFPVTAEEDSDA
ncbi:MAG TPA: DegV family protein [Anaerolineales bacterium]|nr:DegV family protein [Anaerolineales bacterium]